MTAEIAIVNKEAIALAADSAVTINTTSGRKIFNTVNKLFALTNQAPVGVMIYGRADLMGVPWETIIKSHRVALGTKTFPTLDQYSRHFVSFVAHSEEMFPPEIQSQYFRRMTRSSFQLIRTHIEQDIKQALAKKLKVTKNIIERTVDSNVEDYLKYLATRKFLRGVTSGRVAKLRRRYRSVVDSERNEVFQNLPTSKATAKKLSLIPAEVACRREFHVFHSDSGVVIAGFGSDQVFPLVKHMVFGGMIDGLLRYDVIRDSAISHDNEALILPFAQMEMVQTFMEGIDPDCESVVKSYWQTVIDQFPLDVVKAIPSLKPAGQKSLQKKLRAAGKQILEGFRTKLTDYQRQRHINPVIDAIAVLPKDLLAEVAESLVNLTSFKRRISLNSAETVGGPIDVAVISRGDGFVWIKRKHYFKPELNPQFMAHYWR